MNREHPLLNMDFKILAPDSEVLCIEELEPLPVSSILELSYPGDLTSLQPVTNDLDWLSQHVKDVCLSESDGDIDDLLKKVNSIVDPTTIASNTGNSTNNSKKAADLSLMQTNQTITTRGDFEASLLVQKYAANQDTEVSQVEMSMASMEYLKKYNLLDFDDGNFLDRKKIQKLRKLS